MIQFSLQNHQFSLAGSGQASLLKIRRSGSVDLKIPCSMLEESQAIWELCHISIQARPYGLQDIFPIHQDLFLPWLVEQVRSKPESVLFFLWLVQQILDLFSLFIFIQIKRLMHKKKAISHDSSFRPDSMSLLKSTNIHKRTRNIGFRLWHAAKNQL